MESDGWWIDSAEIGWDNLGGDGGELNPWFHVQLKPKLFLAFLLIVL